MIASERPFFGPLLVGSLAIGTLVSACDVSGTIDPTMRCVPLVLHAKLMCGRWRHYLLAAVSEKTDTGGSRDDSRKCGGDLAQALSEIPRTRAQRDVNLTKDVCNCIYVLRMQCVRETRRPKSRGRSEPHDIARIQMAGCTADVERLRRFSPRMRAITTGRQERPVPSRVGPLTAHGTHSAALYMARGSVARRATSTRHASDGRTEDARRPRRSCAQSQPRTEGGQRLRELTRTALTRACPLLRRARSRRPRRVRYSSHPRRTIGCARRHNEGSESGQRKSTRGEVSSTASARTAFCDCNARRSHAGFSSSRCASESSHLLHGESMMTASRRVLTADRAPWRALSMSGLWMGPTSCLYARVRCYYQSN